VDKVKITPMDISNKEFKKVIRGYSSEEVDEFLDNIAEDYEALYKENSSIKEKMLGLNEKIEHYAKMETTIQNTLLLAQNAAEQSKQTAQKEADIIIRSANETSQRILDKAHNDVLKVNDDYERIKQEFIKFRAKFKNFMNTQIEMFESLEKDVVKNYSNDDFRVKNIEDEDFKDDNLNEIKSFFVKSE
jgi:cell division initiation protein